MTGITYFLKRYIFLHFGREYSIIPLNSRTVKVGTFKSKIFDRRGGLRLKMQNGRTPSNIPNTIHFDMKYIKILLHLLMRSFVRYYHRYSCYINSNLRDLMMNHFYYVYLNACNVGFRGYLPSKSKIFGSLNSILEKNLQAIV